MKIDVLIPIHYSNRRLLQQSIRSIQTQTVPTRILCVLNGMSFSDTLSYQSYLKTLGVDKVLVCPQKGVACSLNFAIPHFESDYIARQDDDDISHPERIEILLKQIKSHDADIIGSNILIINSESQKIGFRKYPLNHIDCKRTLVYRTCFCHPSVLMNSRIFQTHVYPITESEDYAFWLSLCKSYKFHNVQIPLYYWRRHSNQASSKSIPYLYFKSSLTLAYSISNNILDLFFLLSQILLFSFWCIYKKRRIDFVHNFIV